MNILRDVWLTLAAIAVFILAASLIFLVLTSPLPPCQAPYVERTFLGTPYCHERR